MCFKEVRELKAIAPISIFNSLNYVNHRRIKGFAGNSPLQLASPLIPSTLSGLKGFEGNQVAMGNCLYFPSASQLNDFLQPG